MTKARKGKGRRAATADGKAYAFLLFVAGCESNSALARANLARLCEGHLKGRHQIAIVDVLKDAASAQENNILVTPTLLLLKPRPQVTVYGNLSDTRQVLAALRLIGGER